MNRRKFIKLVGLSSITALLPLTLTANSTTVKPNPSLTRPIEKAVLVYEEANWIEPEPLYQRVEVSMNQDFDYCALFDQGTGTEIDSGFVITNEDVSQFNYTYRRTKM